MLVLIKGAGDLASGIALRLFRARFDILMTELPVPTAIRRTVAFSTAVFQGETTVEGVRAVSANTEAQIQRALAAHVIPVAVDPQGTLVKRFGPPVVVDAILAKRNLGTRIDDGPVVIAAGPGFTAGLDCHAVVETKRGHGLGRVITEGSALPNTGIPGDIGGYTAERVLRAPEGGIFEPCKAIGDQVEAGETVAFVTGVPLKPGLRGVLRGLRPGGVQGVKGMKAGDVDPRCEPSHCFTVSDKALSVAGGVLEAILRFTRID
jgi:xanthine dehydrogenase accessory factor